MAKNYTFAEAVAIIAEGKDLESIQDLGKRYPLMLHKVATVAAKAGESFVDLANYFPEHLTANKVNGAIKANVTESENEDENEEGEEGTKVEKAEHKGNPAFGAKKLEPKSEDDYENMPNKVLKKMIRERKLKDACGDDFKKENLVKVLKAADAGGSKKAKKETKPEAEAEEEGSENPYEGKTAMELFKECKKRGIEVDPKKPVKYYTELLVKADSKPVKAKVKAEEPKDDEDWDEEETPKAKAKAEKAEPKKAKKTEDDDWDI